jgi:hypothetical protein
MEMCNPTLKVCNLKKKMEDCCFKLLLNLAKFSDLFLSLFLWPLIVI